MWRHVHYRQWQYTTAVATDHRRWRGCHGHRQSPKQPTLPSLFQAKFPANSDRVQKITNAIAIFMALDMRPFSVVKNEGFKYLLSVLEPHYLLPSRAHFSQNVLPKLQEKTKAKVEEGLSTAESIAITTDGWTSRATDSYMAITAHYITVN